MKSTRSKIAALAVVAAIGLFAFTAVNTGSIKGTVTPANSLNSVIAISGKDTLKALIDNGSFSFNDVKPGTYKLVIEGMAPYKNFVKDGVEVVDGKSTDLGAITLQQ
jgi:hypothetical protein